MLTPLGRIVVALLVLLVGGITFLVLKDDGGGGAPEATVETRTFESNDPIERACDLDPQELARLWRGHDDTHSEDVTIVPLPPNYSGSFGTTSHSGPWDYVQTIPLVMYGPGNIKPEGRVEEPASIADVYPTAGRLTGVDLPQREGRVLDSALEPDASPKLIVTVVWDGVGRNVLERWPDRWPTLKRLEEEGTSYVDTVVGSSPSITPATHSTLGTGDYPRRHGMTAIEMRMADGSVGGAFSGRDAFGPPTHNVRRRDRSRPRQLPARRDAGVEVVAPRDARTRNADAGRRRRPPRSHRSRHLWERQLLLDPRRVDRVRRTSRRTRKNSTRKTVKPTGCGSVTMSRSSTTTRHGCDTRRTR